MTKQNITGPLREQSNWDQNDENRLGFIKNKPFYDTRKTAPLTIEWDGEIGGREHNTYPLKNQLFVKVSSVIPTKAEFETGELTAFNSLTGEEETYPLTSDFINEDENGIVSLLDGMIQSVPTEVSAEVNGTVLKFTPGLWFKRMTAEVSGVATDVYITKLSLPSVTTGELKTIDPKFLPSGGGGIPVVDMSDVIDLTTLGESGMEGAIGEVQLTQEHWERIGNDYAPKLLVIGFSPFKVSVLVTPGMLWSESCIDYCGLFTVDGGICILSLTKDESDGYSAARIDIPV